MKPTDKQSRRVLLVEDDRSLGELLLEEIEDLGLRATLADTAEAALESVRECPPDLIVSDLRLPGMDGLSLLRRVRTEIEELPPDFLIITAFGTVDKAVQSLKAGAEDFLTKPLDLDHFGHRVRRILEKRVLREEVERMRSLFRAEESFHGMYGRSRPMVELYRRIRRVSEAGGPVLIVGESGTGKELVAKAIHREGKGDGPPFLAVNCAGIPEPLMESEFFGHEAGAFTGAGKPRRGLFAEADNGTLLLDEISEMPLPLQAKLLRMLQDGKFRPVGSNREKQANVRILAATNRDLEQLVREDTFREDLFFRLETFSLRVPPLRERGDDIELLAGVFRQKHACANGKKIDGFRSDALRLLREYPFPGNVRELNNAVERAVVFCPGREIRREDLPGRMTRAPSAGASFPVANFLESRTGSSEEDLPSLETVENAYIRHVLDRVQGNKRSAASILGIARRTLYRRIQ